VAVATEVPVPSTGSADVVAVDAAAQITIVECKLEKNPEIRRRGTLHNPRSWFQLGQCTR
jgi:RecB family endonuclease NucS